MGSRTVERIPGNSHILHHQRWHPVRILQQLSAGWWGGVWWHVGTHQRRLHDIFCSLYGGVDNLLHSTTFWMTGIHKTLNMNISVEVNCQERGTPQLEGSQCSSIQYDFFSVQCIMGILVWLTGSCKNTVMNNKMYICLIQGVPFKAAFITLPTCLYFLLHFNVIISFKTLPKRSAEIGCNSMCDGRLPWCESE